MNPHDGLFSRVPAASIKGIHGHLQHFYSWTADDDFPFADLQALEAKQVVSGGSPILATAGGRPVYFSWHLGLDGSNRPTTDPSQWGRPVNLRDPAFINFFINNYIRRRMFVNPQLPNYWHAPDNIAPSISLYGYLDNNGVFHSVSSMDPPFWQSDSDLLHSLVYFLGQVHSACPDYRVIGNAGTMPDESQFHTLWGAFDGYCNEDIFNNFGSDSFSRSIVDLVFDRSMWLSRANKVALLQFYLTPGDSTYQDQLRTAYVAYLIYWSAKAYFAPRRADSSSLGIPISSFASLQSALGIPSAPAARANNQQLYWRETTGGIVYLNWSGSSVTVKLPSANWADRNGNSVTSLTIPDLRGDYALRA